MNTAEFLVLLQQQLSSEVRDGSSVFPKITRAQTDIVLQTVLQAILQVVASGGEVRIPNFGVFYPKYMQSEGILVSARLGLRSFGPTNKKIYQQANGRLPGMYGNTSLFEVFSTSGRSRVVDSTGRSLLSMIEISALSGVSLPTCYRYMKQDWFREESERYEKAHRVPLEVKNHTGKRYDKQVAEIFRLKKEDNERRVSPSIEVKGKQLHTVAHVSRITGLSTQTIHRHVRVLGLKTRRLYGREYLTDDSLTQLQKATS